MDEKVPIIHLYWIFTCICVWTDRTMWVVERVLARLKVCSTIIKPSWIWIKSFLAPLALGLIISSWVAVAILCLLLVSYWSPSMHAAGSSRVRPNLVIQSWHRYFTFPLQRPITLLSLLLASRVKIATGNNLDAETPLLDRCCCSPRCIARLRTDYYSRAHGQAHGAPGVLLSGGWGSSNSSTEGMSLC